ncbi:uncharacterized protein LOC129774240 [Toxorhynchites rutilus septentrionalis]|uniref:uncharacterized protein LOC129774240 n=1 Tax=Toxorhynchites rutilus septentrionalis TaxID=329112 RepID=UPI0024793DBA|nr:uncharacterized protein LOC129774240 [Toxorhynchites rutilus septentrionalis]
MGGTASQALGEHRLKRRGIRNSFGTHHTIPEVPQTLLQWSAATTCRMKITDSTTCMQFFIDTGADVSVVPRGLSADNIKPTTVKLFAANGTPTEVYGEVLLKVNLGLHREFLCLESAGSLTVNNQVTIKLFNMMSPYAEILAEFPSITRLAPPGSVSKSSIETTSQPVYATPHRVAPDKLEAACAEFEHLMKLGICQPSSSNWASPLHMVKKAVPGVHVETIVL